MSFGKLVESATNYVKKETGIGENSAKSIGPDTLPWDGINSAKDSFFPKLDIKKEKWSSLYPYRLLVIDIKTSEPVGGNVDIKTSAEESGIDYILTQQPIGGSWIYNFPITPQSISITDQFAVNTIATMRGVVEEHNGVKFKNITMSGTTGIWPQKPTIAGIPRTPSIVGSLFGNSLESFGRVAKQAGKLAKSFSNDSNKTVAEKPKESELTSTGYYQALLLGQFLERYSIAKKDPNNKHWRLVLDIQKENQAFVVTPVGFSLQKSQQSPMEYMWSLQLKAWKRIKIGEVPPARNTPLKLSPNLLQKINNAIRETRRTLSESVNLVKAVRADFAAPFESLRQAALAVKDLGGFVYTAADLPNNINKDINNSIKQTAKILSTAFIRDKSGRSMSNDTKKAINDIVQTDKNNEGLPSDYVQGSLGDRAADQQELGSSSTIFTEPESNFEFFDAISLSNLNVTPQQKQAIDDELLVGSLTTVDDLKKIKSDLLGLALDISNNFGAGSDIYSQIYNRPTPKERITPMSLEEYDIVNSIYESVQAMDMLTATRSFDDVKTQSPLEYVGGLANEAGVEFQDSTSKYLVPVPFGLTIEEISARYLQNPDRWIEIVTLNNLRSPYIDEDGFTYKFLSNASGRQFNVNDSKQRLFLGQRILIKSDIVSPFSRKIINIEKISDTNYLVSVDGEDNLDNLLLSENASVQGYLPGTVNSQDQIYVPTNLPAEEDDRVAQIPAFENDKLTKISKVDWLLDDNGDIAINSMGDFRLANGLNNLVQALKLKISIQKNSLLRHPEFGVGISPGVSVADITSGDIFNDLNKLITDDPRFSGIERLDIKISGPTITIDMAVSVANGSGIIPISFSV